MNEYAGETADLTISLDVIYHLVEDDIFTNYMNQLFNSAERFVVVYSSNTDKTMGSAAAHVRHRRFSKWVSDIKPEWTLTKYIPNKHPFNGDNKNSSFSDFYIYSKL